jgi:hypothetical protein
MNIKLFSKTSQFVIAAFVLILTVGIWNETLAQQRQVKTYICPSDVTMGLAPGQTLRLVFYNPTENTIAGPHVRVFTGTGASLLDARHTPLGAGQFDWFDINYSDLPQLAGEGNTGRRQIRINATITYTGVESEAELFRPSWELVDTATGQTQLIGLLLPAIQKVRD